MRLSIDRGWSCCSTVFKYGDGFFPDEENIRDEFEYETQYDFSGLKEDEYWR